MLSGVGCVAALLLPTAVTAQAAPLSRVPAADGKKGQELPGMPSSIDADAACTPASGEKAKKQDWSRQRLDLDRLHGYSTGAGVTVALIDTGVDTGAEGLGGRVTAEGTAGDDCVGHGTFLAGLIAGAGGGGAQLTGVAPGAEILALRGTDQRGAGFVRTWTDPVHAGNPALSKADVGAYEFRGDALFVGDFERP
jgi:subtilisin family serine protease